MTAEGQYTTQLQAGLGMVDETRILLELWQPGEDTRTLFQSALDAGCFPGSSARRLRNLVGECFAPRYLVNNGTPSNLLKSLLGSVSSSAFNQLLFLYTCRANRILADFVRQVYWERYSSGHDTISNENARAFVIQANQDGFTSKPWSESTIRRVSGYLTGCCADYGLLEKGRKSVRKIVPHRIDGSVVAILAYDLHFAGKGDNAVIMHPDWALFGLEPGDVRDELRRLSLRGFFIYQTAGDVTRLGWTFKTWEEVTDVLAQG